MIGEYIMSAITAFIISAGGALGVVTFAGGTTALNKTAWIGACVVGAIAAAKDVRALMKLPPIDTGNPPTSSSKLPLLFLVAGLAVGLVACATLESGADPMVVRMEQTLEGATNTLQTVVHVDQLNRGFWRTNVPVFHDLAESLRQPVWAPGMKEPEPWGVSLIQNAWNVKQAYKLSRTSVNSNLLWVAWVTLNSTVTNAQQQLSIVNSTNFVWLH